jgi:hypothetical protein
MLLRLGYFPDFIWDDTILVGGDRAGLDRLAALLTPLTAPGAPAIELHQHAQVSVWKPVHLTAMSDSADSGVRRQHDVQDVPAFLWQRSPAGWTQILELLAGVSSGHQWLQSEVDDEAVVMVSAEYPEAWWESHG